MSGISGLNLDNVYSGLQTGVSANEASMKGAMNTDLSDNKNLMALQQQMQKWTIATQTQSNVIKTMGDAMKATVSNIR